MEMIVDTVKLKEVLLSMGLDDGCSDGTCSNCKLQAALQELPKYKEYLFQLMITSAQSHGDFLYPIHLALLHGFILAWEYRNTLELERIAKL